MIRGARGIAGWTARKLLHDAPEVAFADVVHLGLRRWRRLLMAVRRGRLREPLEGGLVERALPDGLPELVYAQVMLVMVPVVVIHNGANRANSAPLVRREKGGEEEGFGDSTADLKKGKRIKRVGDSGGHN